MNTKILKKVQDARNYFEIQDFPSNFFDVIDSTDDILKKYNLLIFKEDIGKLSGFIGYTESGVGIICINYKRSLGHQNFTLAHEIGHFFLHKGVSNYDTDKDLYSRSDIENEANSFANEILYPKHLFEADYKEIRDKDLLNKDKRKELAEKIDEICHKYCISFECALRKILYKNMQGNKYKEVRKEIEISIGCVISNYFDHDFYITNESNKWYQPSKKPYEVLKKYVQKLYNDNKISLATAESILFKYGMEIE
ncbi:ImmA/IrrE family metallo-endopeptidase [Clostridium perfringens]